MGATVSDYHGFDTDGREWVVWGACPYCGALLATMDWIDRYEPDEVVGCDDCNSEVTAGETVEETVYFE